MGHGNFRKWGLPTIALLGALIALVVVFWSQRKVPTPPILFPPPTSPYDASIAGAGIIEASSLNISIGTPFTQIVRKVFVTEGDKVKAGDPLFRIDTRSLEAQARAAFAQIQLALVTVEDKKAQVSFYERLHDKTSASEQAYSQVVYALKEAQENYNVALANYEVILTDIERSIITSPLDAFILQVNTAVGEIAITQTIPQAPTVSFSTTQAPLILLGSICPPHIRIDVDEDDAWRYISGARATAFVRGNSNIHFPLKFVRVEPYIIPKVSFTGDTSERIDTRVLQVLYAFEWGNYPIYVGQILDIFIEAEPLNPPSKGRSEQGVATECEITEEPIANEELRSCYEAFQNVYQALRPQTQAVFEKETYSLTTEYEMLEEPIANEKLQGCYAISRNTGAYQAFKPQTQVNFKEDERSPAALCGIVSGLILKDTRQAFESRSLTTTTQVLR